MQGTTKVVKMLVGEGFEVSPNYVAFLIRENIIPAPEKGVADFFVWSNADIARLRSALMRRGRGPR